jgi:hypothetical protein
MEAIIDKGTESVWLGNELRDRVQLRIGGRMRGSRTGKRFRGKETSLTLSESKILAYALLGYAEKNSN